MAPPLVVRSKLTADPRVYNGEEAVHWFSKEPVLGAHRRPLEVQPRSPEQRHKIQAEYVWIDENHELRTGMKTLDKVPDSVNDLPEWCFDGASTKRATGQDSELWLVPRAFYQDPLCNGPTGSSSNILVLCDCYKSDTEQPGGVGEPIASNTRVQCVATMEQVREQGQWFTIEQEFTLFGPDRLISYGCSKEDIEDGAKGPSSSSIGKENSYYRSIIEAHYHACLNAGIYVSGIHTEVMPGQWEYQVGPCIGIESADQLVVSRYLLMRICRQFGVRVSFGPKPIADDRGGERRPSSVYTKASGGMRVIHNPMDVLGGEASKRRLTGARETPISQFLYAVDSRGHAMRIPRMREKENGMDPYVVTSKIMAMCVSEK